MNHPARGSYEQSLVEAAAARKQRLYGPAKSRPVYIPPVQEVIEIPKPKKVKLPPRAEGMNRPYSSTVKEIIAQEMHAAKLTQEDFFSHTRRHAVCRPKHIAAYRINLHTNLSHPQISKALGYYDHTSAIYAIKKIRAEVERAERMARNVSELKAIASSGAHIDEIVAHGYSAAVPVKEIAKIAGRTVNAIVSRASRLGLSSPALRDAREYRRRISEGQAARWAQRKECQEAVGA